MARVIVIKYGVDQKMEPACELILGHSSDASLATGPVIALPLVQPLLFTITPALSSQYRKVPSGLLQARRCLMMTAGCTFFLSFWTPFLTEQRTTSPMDPAGSRLRLPLTPCAAMMQRFFAPELSAQLRVAATGSPRVILSLTPTAPVLVFLAIDQQYNIQYLMFQFFTSFAASSNFEKHRLEITTKSFDAPSEQALRSITNTFCGQDPETKSQIAFATIVKKLLTSDSRHNWLYLLKNLIILDRIVEENVFTEEICDLAVPTIDAFREGDPRNMFFETEGVISTYWRLIKEKSAALSSKKHIFCFKRSQRTEFLSKLNCAEMLKQMQSIENFFAITYEFVQCLAGKKIVEENAEAGLKIEKGREEWSKSKLMEYLCLQVLHKLMLYYSCQLQCNQAFLLMLTRQAEKVKEEEIRRFKRHISKFKLNADEYIRFVESRKNIKGFEIVNYKELNPYEIEPILKLLDQFIAQNSSNSHKPVFETLIVPEDQMRVEKKPFADLNSDMLIPRIKQRPVSGKGEELATNAFSNWVNSFSSSFPQNEVLSLDLILHIKREEENKENSEEIVDDSNRQSCAYSNRDTNITANYQISQQLWRKSPPQPLAFSNKYSQLPNKWNF